MWVMITKHNFRNDAIRWKMSKSANVSFTILIFAKVRPVRTKVAYTDRQTDRHVHRNWQAHSYRRYHADLPKKETPIVLPWKWRRCQKEKSGTCSIPLEICDCTFENAIATRQRTCTQKHTNTEIHTATYMLMTITHTYARTHNTYKQRGTWVLNKCRL